MAKNLKLNIKNAQIAKAMNLGSLKKAASKKEVENELKEAPAAEVPKTLTTAKAAPTKESVVKEQKEAPAKAKTSAKGGNEKSVKKKSVEGSESHKLAKGEAPEVHDGLDEESKPRVRARSRSAFADPHAQPPVEAPRAPASESSPLEAEEEPVFSTLEETPPAVEEKTPPPPKKEPEAPKRIEPRISSTLLGKKEHTFLKDLPVREKFGPTGRHVNDLLPKKPPTPPPAPKPKEAPAPQPRAQQTEEETAASQGPAKAKGAKFKEFRDLKPAKRAQGKGFDSRDSRGLRGGDDDSRNWRRKKQKQMRHEEDTTIRPSELTIRLPITIKDLAQEMKLKASQLVQKLFMQGVITTLNDEMSDAETVQLLGMEFGCNISVDTTEQERIQITGKSIQEEISETPAEDLVTRAPVVAFMGHVDHGKTSLIDYIRKTNRTAGEAGAITQHIGAFMCHTTVGEIAILDTPGHEAFSAMRERGANVTDIIVLVVAGDEGIRQQTVEAINHAKTGGVNIVVAINKCDKPNFNAENVYRQLSEHELLPEAWGGETITVNCSATTGEGVQNLLDMLALQAEVLELKACPTMRARGTVIESELHKGLGSKATILVQNGTLKKGDALVFEEYWGKVKTMHNEDGREVESAGPSHPVEITGLSGLPDAGQEFIVVANEKEAKDISQKRSEGIKQNALKIKRSFTMENMLESSKEAGKKTLNVVLRADVQGSLEALKTALEKIKSDKADLNIVHTGVGEVSESDVQLAGASKAVIVGFHTAVESHAEALMKELKVEVVLHDIIYHAVDDVKRLMKNLLDKIPQENEQGKAFVKAVFKSSHLGMIAGCQVTEGVINRNHLLRVVRGGEVIFKGTMLSLKKIKEDVREVGKGIECGILINNFNDPQPDDIIETYDITYLTQEL